MSTFFSSSWSTGFSSAIAKHNLTFLILIEYHKITHQLIVAPMSSPHLQVFLSNDAQILQNKALGNNFE
jgi:hypothetical protein